MPETIRPPQAPASLRVDQARLWDTLMEMARVGGLPAGGCRRLALSAEDREGRDLFVKWCRDAGCHVRVDSIGNIFARRPGSRAQGPSVASGSHLDTQPHGGKFDGVYGVLAALEVVRTLNEAGVQTEAPIDVVVWTNEEAARFSPPLAGSGVYAGRYRLDEVHAQPTIEGGTVLGDLVAIGYLGDEAPGDRRFDSFLEAHIEQGPILQAAGLPIGVVTQIQGIRWLSVEVVGQDAHAGTMPMTGRRDALTAAARMVVALDELARSKDEATRLTVGRLDVSPNSGSTIPGRVTFNIDLRHPDAGTLDELEAAIRAGLEDIAARSAVQVGVRGVMDVPPVHFDPALVGCVRAAARALGLPNRDMLSGAAHDAMNVARCAATAMIFIPSQDGVSHNEAEYSTPEQVAAGANVLLHAVLARAGVAPGAI